MREPRTAASSLADEGDGFLLWTVCWAVLVVVVLVGTGCSAGPAGNERPELPRDVYVDGPFGTDEGSTLQNLAFTDGAGAALTLQDVRADDDARLLLLVTSAGWCSACVQEQPELQRLFEEHQAEGLRVVVSLFQDDEFAPATPALARQWQQAHDLAFDVVVDPDFALADYYDTALTPMNMMVHLGSMTIERITTGWDPDVVEGLIGALL